MARGDGDFVTLRGLLHLVCHRLILPHVRAHPKQLREVIEAFVTSDSNGVINDSEAEHNYLLVKAFTKDEPPPNKKPLTQMRWGSLPFTFYSKHVFRTLSIALLEWISGYG